MVSYLPRAQRPAFARDSRAASLKKFPIVPAHEFDNFSASTSNHKRTTNEVSQVQQVIFMVIRWLSSLR
jgi:hypothetical protein